jgi:hypothetical protein
VVCFPRYLFCVLLVYDLRFLFRMFLVCGSRFFLLLVFLVCVFLFCFTFYSFTCFSFMFCVSHFWFHIHALHYSNSRRFLSLCFAFLFRYPSSRSSPHVFL